MRKTEGLLLGLALVALLVLLYSALTGSPGELGRARAEAAAVAAERDSVLAVVRARDAAQEDLAAQRDQRAREVTVLRDSIEALERARATAQWAVRRIRGVGALQEKLRSAFPELGRDGWGLTTMPVDAGDAVGLEYLVVPAWFAETFMIDHANAESWRAQKDRLVAVDSLGLTITALQDSILQLEAAKREAYASGYAAAAHAYQTLSARYQAELRKPRFSLGSPAGLVAAAGVGFLLGSIIK